MNGAASMAGALAFALLTVAPVTHSAAPPPPFDVAYRAWEVVTVLARHHGDPTISGECGKTFRPFVSAGLRMQTRPEQDAAATACFEAARSACSNRKLRATAETAKKCEEFR